MALFGLLGRRHERAGFMLYTAAVGAARDPVFYERLGVPDTLDGRFDLVGLHAFLLIRRLRAIPAPGPAVAQAVFDAMFSDMDINLRELGVGDMSISKRVKAMWEAFHGRATAYDAPLAAGDLAALEAAIVRNVFREAAHPGAAAIAQIALDQAAHLDRQPAAGLAAGQVNFLSPGTLLAAQAA